MVANLAQSTTNSPARDPAPASQPGSGRVSVIETGPRLVFVTIGVLLATLLELIDTTIVNVALPYIQGNIGASLEEGTFIVTGYIVANVIVIPLTPWLQRRFGRRQYFFASILVFTAASLMCGLSRSLTELVFWRVIQGLGGGGLISTSQAILRESFPPNKQAAAQAIFSVGVIIGPTIGPVLGGVLTDALSWPWVFFVNIPVGIAAMFLVGTYLRNPEPPQKLAVDGVGVALLAVGLGSLQYVLDQGQEKDWFGSDAIVAGSVIAALTLTAFIWWELFGARSPVVDLRILKNRSVAAGSLLGACLGVSLLGSLVTLPQFVQQSLGFTATLAGEVILFRALTVMILTIPSARLAATGKVSPVLQIGTGFFLLAISNVWLAAVTTTGSDYWTFFLPLALSGAGLAQIFVPLSLAVFGSVEPRDVPKASAMFNLLRQLGGSVATAVLVTIISRQEAVHTTALAQRATLAQPEVRQYLGRRGGPDSPAARAGLNDVIVAQSTALAYADTARDVGYLTFFFVPLVLFLRKRQPPPAPVKT
jgi:DHA2 family multidrug resistance protein